MPEHRGDAPGGARTPARNRMAGRREWQNDAGGKEVIAPDITLIGMVDVGVEPAGIRRGRAVAPRFITDKELVETVGTDTRTARTATQRSCCRCCWSYLSLR